MSERIRQETSEEEITTPNEYSSVKENTEEYMKEEFRRDSIFIKVSSEDTFKFFFFKIPECIPIDVRACFKRLYPHSENYYSEKKECSSNITARNMHEVANYCIIDALRCQKLTVKCNVKNDYREVASIAYIFLFDTHYCANEMKAICHGNCSEKKGLYLIILEDLFNKRVDLKSKFTLLRKEKEHLEKLISTIKGKAEGITSAGQYNIGLVARFIIVKGFGIKYDNTNSLYLICLDKYYEKCDRDYNKNKLSKETYWSKIVKITMKVMDEFHNKKYFKVAHKEIVNFKPKKLFTKSIDTVKQGQTELFRFVEEKTMRKAMNIDNTHTIYQIIKDTLREASEKQWEFNQFVIPDLDERFSYVVMKSERYRDENGQLILCRNANYLEFPDIAKEFNMKIDINYYLEKQLDYVHASLMMIIDINHSL
ncbi:9506_t:CDS:2, partial [Cetraspora pellucida]